MTVPIDQINKWSNVKAEIERDTNVLYNKMANQQLVLYLKIIKKAKSPG